MASAFNEAIEIDEDESASSPSPPSLLSSSHKTLLARVNALIRAELAKKDEQLAALRSSHHAELASLEAVNRQLRHELDALKTNHRCLAELMGISPSSSSSTTITSKQTAHDLNDLALLRTFSFLSVVSLKRLRAVSKRWLALIDETLHERMPRVHVTVFRGESWSPRRRIVGKSKLPSNAITQHQRHHQLVITRSAFECDFRQHLLYDLQLRTQPALFLYFLTDDYYAGTCLVLNNDSDTNLSSSHTNNQQQQQLHEHVVKRRYMAYVASLLTSHLPADSLALFISVHGFVDDKLAVHVAHDGGIRCECDTDDADDHMQHSNHHHQHHHISPPSIGGLLLPHSATSAYRFDVRQLIDDQFKLHEIDSLHELERFFGVRRDQGERIRFIYMLRNDVFGHSVSSVNKFFQLINRLRANAANKSDNRNGTETDNDDDERIVVCGASVPDVCSNKRVRSPTDYKRITVEFTFLVLIENTTVSVGSGRQRAVKIAQAVVSEPSRYDFDNDEDDSDETDAQHQHNNLRNRTRRPSRDSMLKEKLSLLKQTKICETNEMAVGKKQNPRVMFALHTLSGSSKAETALFLETFPNVPSFGTISCTQLGHDHLPNVQVAAPFANANLKMHRSDQNCSIFTVFSLTS